MTISSLSSSTLPPSSQQSNFASNWQALIQALQSGNLAAAQQAYATLTQSLASQGGTAQSSPLSQFLNQIGADLQSNNLGGAQQALATFTQQAQAQPHHHHHHPSGGDASQGSSASTSTGSTTGTTLSSTTTGGIDLTV